MMGYSESSPTPNRRFLSRRRGAGSALLCALLMSACGGSATPEARSTASKSRQRPSEELFQLGRNAFERGDSVRAEQYLSLALEQGYEPRRVVPLLLQVCLQSSRLRAALNHAEPFLLEHPENDGLRYLVATIHLSLGQEEEARFELEQLLHQSPRFADAKYLMGILELSADPHAAREHFLGYLALASRGSHATEVRSRLAQLAVGGLVRQQGRLRRDQPADTATVAVPTEEPSSTRTPAPVHPMDQELAFGDAEGDGQ